MFVFNSFSPEQNQNDIDYSTFLNEVQNDRVSEVVIADLIIYGERTTALLSGRSDLMFKILS